MTTLAELIDSYEATVSKGVPCPEEAERLKGILRKLGRVSHRDGQEWHVDSRGGISHLEYAPGSPRAKGPDGEEAVYTNSSHVKLDAF